MSGNVWVSFAPGKTQIWKKLTNEWSEEGQRARMRDVVKRNDLGEALSREDFPPEFFGQLSAAKRDYKFGDFFVANKLTIVSAAVAETLARFDLGNAKLYPIPIFQKDRQTLVDGEWFILNFGNTKDAFVPEESADVEQIEGTDYWMMPIAAKDGDVAVSARSLEGPDIWVDPRCMLVFFMSDRLAREIKARKLARYCFLRKCRVV